MKLRTFRQKQCENWPRYERSTVAAESPAGAGAYPRKLTDNRPGLEQTESLRIQESVPRTTWPEFPSVKRPAKWAERMQKTESAKYQRGDFAGEDVCVPHFAMSLLCGQ